MTHSFTITTVCTIDPVVRGSAITGLLLDRPDTVAITLDILDGAVRHVVSDWTGVLETEIAPLEHACTSCATREDALPTLVRLAREQRWRHALVAMPIGSEPAPLVRLLDQELARKGSLAGATFGGVCLVVDADDFVGDAFSDDWLADRDPSVATDQVVAEALAPMLVAADTIVLTTTSEPSRQALTLAEHLRGDGARVVACDSLDLGPSMDTRRATRTRDCLERADPLRLPQRTAANQDGVWTLRLTSEHPFDPTRLRDNVHRLASHPVRARGHFTVSSRPGSSCAWEGAAGLLSVADLGRRPARGPRVDLVVTGVGDSHASITRAFAETLAQPGEAVSDDALEDWLGHPGAR
ncbi:GTP-binding protein [Demequina sp.]|uniref:GTP-binding protein n=1 Tax=Demequina sp. TaxID=2050685 RepID=UPI003A8BAC44